MNKYVYIVHGGWDYNGDEINGVCSTKEKAKKIESAFNDENYDYIVIEKHEVDKKGE